MQFDVRQKGLGPEVAEQGAKGRTREFANMLHVPYYGHIEPAQFEGPSGFHIARATYYIGTPSFNPKRVEGLPAGFMINRAYLSDTYAKTEADLSVKIATGDHGFGERITKENPFLLIAIGDAKDPSLSVEKLKAELSFIEQASNGRVRVDGFTAPVL